MGLRRGAAVAGSVESRWRRNGRNAAATTPDVEAFRHHAATILVNELCNRVAATAAPRSDEETAVQVAAANGSARCSGVDERRSSMETMTGMLLLERPTVKTTMIENASNHTIHALNTFVQLGTQTQHGTVVFSLLPILLSP